MHIDAMDGAARIAAVTLLAGALAGCGGFGSREATSPEVTLPEELVVEAKGRRRKHVHAYWDGCAYVV